MTRLHVVLCEGFDDRAFLKGWLLRLGCIDPTVGQARPRVSDAWGRVVAGAFGFITPEGEALRVQPIHGMDFRQPLRDVLEKHRGRGTQGRIVLVRDSDDLGAVGESALASLRGLIDNLGGESAGEPPWTLEGHLVEPVVLGCDLEPEPGVPEQQTLERLVCAALRDVHIDRAASVERWLSDPPTGGQGHKEHAWSWYSKWFAEHGTGDFYQEVWRQEQVASRLETHLRTTGAWEPLARLVAEDSSRP